VTANPTERELAARALDHECPNCGAKVGARCLTPNNRTHRQREPHPERAALSWQEMLREMREAVA
jgi:hypothetical protein